MLNELQSKSTGDHIVSPLPISFARKNCFLLLIRLLSFIVTEEKVCSQNMKVQRYFCSLLVCVSHLIVGSSGEVQSDEHRSSHVKQNTKRLHSSGDSRTNSIADMNAKEASSLSDLVQLAEFPVSVFPWLNPCLNTTTSYSNLRRIYSKGFRVKTEGRTQKTRRTQITIVITSLINNSVGFGFA